MYNLENKICSFNVNEYHLVTMLMPYIYEEVNYEKEVITFFEKDLTESYEKVLNTNNLFWRNREVLDKIDWKKLDPKKLSSKFEKCKDNDIVIVAGREEFINRINRLISNFHTNFTLVNCFEINNFEEDIEKIINNHSKMLNTKGIKEIEKLNFA